MLRLAPPIDAPLIGTTGSVELLADSRGGLDVVDRAELRVNCVGLDVVVAPSFALAVDRAELRAKRRWTCARAAKVDGGVDDRDISAQAANATPWCARSA